jgi:hypothetical protein
VEFSNPNIQISLICLISINTTHKPTPRDKPKMPRRKFQNFTIEAIDASVYAIPFKDPKIIRTLYQQKTTQALKIGDMFINDTFGCYSNT